MISKEVEPPSLQLPSPPTGARSSRPRLKAERQEQSAFLRANKAQGRGSIHAVLASGAKHGTAGPSEISVHFRFHVAERTGRGRGRWVGWWEVWRGRVYWIGPLRERKVIEE